MVAATETEIVILLPMVIGVRIKNVFFPPNLFFLVLIFYFFSSFSFLSLSSFLSPLSIYPSISFFLAISPMSHLFQKFFRVSLSHTLSFRNLGFDSLELLWLLHLLANSLLFEFVEYVNIIPIFNISRIDVLVGILYFC